MKKLRFETADVFTTTRFGGNPLAVVYDADGLSSARMQAIAREFNLSETVFALKPKDAANTAWARIFTPVYEMPFAGHPTVGAGVLLARARGGSGAHEIRLEEQVGVVPVAVDLDDGPGYGALSAAVMPSLVPNPPDAAALAAALSLEGSEIGFGEHRPGAFSSGPNFAFAPVANRESLARAAPVAAEFARINAEGRVGVVVYCAGAGGDAPDYHIRMFAPNAGVGEDPATGSAAAAFPGALLAAGMVKAGENRLHLAQGEDMGRPSRIDLSFEVSERAIQRIEVGGHVTPVSSGEIIVEETP